MRGLASPHSILGAMSWARLRSGFFHLCARCVSFVVVRPRCASSWPVCSFVLARPRCSTSWPVCSRRNCFWLVFAGDYAPRAVLSSLVGRPMMLGIMAGMEQKDSFALCPGSDMYKAGIAGDNACLCAGFTFWGPVHRHRAGGHVHRDMTP